MTTGIESRLLKLERKLTKPCAGFMTHTGVEVSGEAIAAYLQRTPKPATAVYCPRCGDSTLRLEGAPERVCGCSTRA